MTEDEIFELKSAKISVLRILMRLKFKIKELANELF